MDWFIWIIVAVPALGVGIAIYERCKKRVLLKHDLAQDPAGMALKTDIERAADAFRPDG